MAESRDIDAESTEAGASQQPANPTKPHAAEAVEAMPELRLTVAGECNNNAGKYVGLNQGQREALHVSVGGTVELLDDEGKRVGIFTVGTGSKSLSRTPGQFTANGIDTGKTVTLRAMKGPPEGELPFELQHGIEGANSENHIRRQGIIRDRLNLDPEAYVTIPTSLAAQIGIKPAPGKTIAPISKATIKGVDGVEHEVAIVPTGTAVGLTTAAAEKLQIPIALRTIRLRVDAGKLVIG